MNDRVKELENAASDPTVFFREYTNKRAKISHPIFIIEGKDDPKFYTANISFVFGSDWDFISIGGKSKVLQVRGMIRNNCIYKNDLVAFLVDKDFDETVSCSDLYVTPTYSIENLYCSPNTFRRMITGECGLSDFKIDFDDNIKDALTFEYQRIRRKFHDNRRIIIANALFMYTRKILGDYNISLDDIVKFEVTIEAGSVLVKMKKRKHYHMFKSKKNDLLKFFLTHPDWRDALTSPGENFRGKQEILFFRAALAALKENGYFSKFAQATFGMSVKLENPALSDHVLSTVAQYVTRPECLKNFLLNFKVTAMIPPSA